MKKVLLFLLTFFMVLGSANMAFAKPDWNKFIGKLYTNNNKEYNKTIIVLAKLLHGEGGKTITNKAAVAWCVLNRVDRARGRSI